MSEYQDSSHSADEIDSEVEAGVVYGPLDPTRDYLSEYRRAHEEVQSETLHIHGEAHKGVRASSIKDWSEALKDDLDENELLEVVQADIRLRQLAQDCERDFETNPSLQAVRTDLAEYEALSVQDKHHGREMEESSSRLSETDRTNVSASSSGIMNSQPAEGLEIAKLQAEKRELQQSHENMLQDFGVLRGEYNRLYRQLMATTNELTATASKLHVHQEVPRNTLGVIPGSGIQAQDVSQCRADRVSAYKVMFLRLFLKSETQIDLARFRESWDVVLKCLRTFEITAGQATAQIHGFDVESDTGTSAIELGLRMLMDAQSDSGVNVTDMHQLDYAIAHCGNRERITSLAMIYALVSRVVSAHAFDFESSMVLLRGSAILLSWVNPYCDAIIQLGNSLAQIKQDLCRSSVLVSAMATVVFGRLSGTAIELVDALHRESMLHQCRAVKDGYTFIREARRGLTIVMPNREIVFFSIDRISLEKHDPMAKMMVDSGEADDYCYRLAFHDRAFLSTWKTTWWTYDDTWAILGTIADLLRRKRAIAGSSLA